MKKYLYRVVFLLMVGFLIYPQITLAAWWNPFTWKIFRTATTTQSVNTDPLSILNIPTSDAQTQIKPQTPPEKKRETTIDQTPTQTTTIPPTREIASFLMKML